jgi:hypothetical protein
LGASARTTILSKPLAQASVDLARRIIPQVSWNFFIIDGSIPWACQRSEEKTDGLLQWPRSHQHQSTSDASTSGTGFGAANTNAGFGSNSTNTSGGGLFGAHSGAFGSGGGRCIPASPASAFLFRLLLAGSIHVRRTWRSKRSGLRDSGASCFLGIVTICFTFLELQKDKSNTSLGVFPVAHFNNSPKPTLSIANC